MTASTMPQRLPLVMLRSGPMSLGLDQPALSEQSPLVALINSRKLILYPCGPQMPGEAASPFGLITVLVQRHGQSLPPAEASAQRKRSRLMSNVQIEPLYEVVVNANGQVLLAIAGRPGEPVQPQLLLSEAGGEALLKRGGGLPDVALTDLHPEAAQILRALPSVLVVEAGGDGSLRHYQAPIQKLTRPLDL